MRRGHCAEHETTRRKKDPEQQRYYGSTVWKKIRALVRAEEPVCRLCKRNATDDVDHIDGDWRNNARENLRGLCWGCHRSLTARQHKGRVYGSW